MICPWCQKRFDRFENFYLHHRVQHNRDKQYSYSWVLAFVAEQVGRKKTSFLKILELENFFSNFQAGLVKCPGCKCAYPEDGWGSRHEAECRRKKYPANNNNNNNNNNSSQSDILGCKSKKKAVVKMKKLMLPPPAKKQRTAEVEVENEEGPRREKEVDGGDDEQEEEGEEVEEEEEEEEERRIEDEALRDAVVEVEENGDAEDVNSSSGGSRKRGHNSNSNSAGQEVQPLSKFFACAAPAASTTTSSDRHHQQEQQQHRPFVIKIKRDEEGEASKDLRPQAEDDEDEPAKLLLKRCLLMPKCPWCVPARRFLDAKSLNQHVEGVHDKSNFIKLFAHSMYRSCLLLYIYRQQPFENEEGDARHWPQELWILRGQDPQRTLFLGASSGILPARRQRQELPEQV